MLLGISRTLWLERYQPRDALNQELTHAKKRKNNCEVKQEVFRIKYIGVNGRYKINEFHIDKNSMCS